MAKPSAIELKSKSNDFSQKTPVFLINQNETSNWKTLYVLLLHQTNPNGASK